ncbi:MAG: hypothetical protein ACRERU_21325 [Methylococcales bacterium]
MGEVVAQLPCGAGGDPKADEKFGHLLFCGGEVLTQIVAVRHWCWPSSWGGMIC